MCELVSSLSALNAFSISLELHGFGIFAFSVLNSQFFFISMPYLRLLVGLLFFRIHDKLFQNFYYNMFLDFTLPSSSVLFGPCISQRACGFVVIFTLFLCFIWTMHFLMSLWLCCYLCWSFSLLFPLVLSSLLFTFIFT